MNPPKLAESVVGFLLPPASREHVLGDLHERCTSRRQYILDALTTVPSVILSQVRRTTDPPVLLLEAFALYLAYVTAAWWLNGPLFRNERGLLLLAIPALAGLLAFMVAGVYTVPGKPQRLQVFVQAALAVSFAFLAGPTVPRSILLLGGGLGVLLLSALRISFPPWERVAAITGAPGSRRFHEKLRRGHLTLFLSVLILACFGLTAVVAQPVTDRVAGGVILAAALYIFCQVCRRSRFRAAVRRTELERQRDALRGFWLWYIGPYLGALLTFALRLPLAHPDEPALWKNIVPFVALSVVWAVAVGQQAARAARKLQEEIDTLDRENEPRR